MANRFTAGNKAISECDRCGIRVKLKDLKKLVIKTKQVAIKVCNECWEEDHPQLQLGMYPVADPQAVRDPRPDFAGYAQSRSNIVPVQNFLNSEEYTSAGGEIGTVVFAAAPPPVACDPYFAYVSLLLHMDGTNGSTMFTDNSPSPKTVTANGSAQVNTSVVKYGTGSAYFANTGFDYLLTSTTTDFYFGTGAFTIEAWVYIAGNSDLDGNGNRHADIVSSGYPLSGAKPSSWALIIAGDSTTTGTGLILSCWVSNTEYVSRANVSVTQGVWHHVAVSRSAASSPMLFLDGVLQTLTVSGITGSTAVDSDTAYYTRVGCLNYAGFLNQLNGYIDDFRITKGIARYTSNFTPPTEAFPNAVCPANGAPVDSSIKFLMSFDGDFTEANGLITTQNSSPIIEGTIAKFGSGSLDTVNGVASVSAAGLPSRASGDPFTIEAWFYVTNNLPGGGWDIIKAHGNASLQLYAEVSPNYNYYVFRLGANYIGYQAGPTTYPVNQWVHMRGVWQSGTGYLFINGVLWDSRALSAAGGTDNTAIVGPLGSSSMSPRNLFIDEAAIFNTAVTTSNFTPPTTAYARV